MNYKISPLGKKGSHTGMVLSFVVFITSLIVIYAVVDIPSNDSLEKKYSIDILKSNLIKEISHNFIISRVNDKSGAGVCANFSTPTNSFSNIDVIAIDSTGSIIPSLQLNGRTYIENGDNLTKIYYMNGTDFETSPISSTVGCVVSNVTNIIYDNIIFESSIVRVINETEFFYDELKAKLGAPNDDEFQILFTSNDTSIGNFDINDIKTNIYVAEYRINYISTKGKEEMGVFKIGLW